MTTVKNGSKGDDVKILQQRLGLTVDGIFGKNTEKAVKEFQKANGLTADGIVGPKTWEKLGVSDTVKPTSTTTNSKQVDPCVVYNPISTHITCSKNRPIQYLVIHYTAGCSSKTGSVLNTRNVFIKRQASADFVVDDTTMIQINPDLKNYYTWAVGDGKGAYGVTNKNSISIEMCSYLDKGTSACVPNHPGWHISEAVLANTAKLAKILMKMYNIPFNRVIRHYDASRKACPGICGWNDGTLYDATTGKKTTKKNTSEKWLEWKKRLLM